MLHILVENPDREFTNRELHRVTKRGLSSVNAAVDTLHALGVITVDRSGRANGVQIDPEILVKSTDPVTAIPQPEYHAPVRALLGELTKRITAGIGVILFGSVARGTADRTSDIDLFVVVDGNRMETQREAHAIERSVQSIHIIGLKAILLDWATQLRVWIAHPAESKPGKNTPQLLTEYARLSKHSTKRGPPSISPQRLSSLRRRQTTISSDSQR